ncbi:MAG: formate dehydrogenase accessory sulfurtransferase FdhD [Steroidobacteraceae bacterium]
MNVKRDDEPVRRIRIDAMRGGQLRSQQDLVVVEEPLEIRLARVAEPGPGRAISITMRTPGHDVELAVGFLHGEGLIRSRDDITSARVCGPTGNVVRVELGADVQLDLARLERNFYTSSSCGVCGKASLDAVHEMLPIRAVGGTTSVSAALLGNLVLRARSAQDVFRDTGGLHASSLFDAHGDLLATYEDVGRHNALDKLVGARLLEGALPLSGCVLLLSGRASFELLQKAAAAGVPVVAAVGAPSSLAIDLAERTGILLIGFLRDQSFNVYTHRERLQ